MMKSANVIVVGGPIASGKSSLVGSLNYIPVQELDPNDELQKILLRKMYEGDKVAPQIFQLDMMLTRFDKYKKLANNEKMHVFDRMIFEDRIFAWLLLKSYPPVWEYYKGIWEDKVKEITEEIGIPKMYIILSTNWENFQKRIFKRNRKSEVDNFEKNKEYFKKLLDIYDQKLIEILEQYQIPYKVIDTNKLDRLEVIEEAKKILAEAGIE